MLRGRDVSRMLGVRFQLSRSLPSAEGPLDAFRVFIDLTVLASFGLTENGANHAESLSPAVPSALLASRAALLVLPELPLMTWFLAKTRG